MAVQLFDDGEGARHERQHFVHPLGCFIAVDAEEGTKEPLVANLAPRTRIERATCPLGGGCSIH